MRRVPEEVRPRARVPFEKPPRSTSTPLVGTPAEHRMLSLQRAVGNRALARLVHKTGRRQLQRYRLFPRALNDNEVPILRPVYGDRLDYSAIQINESSLLAVDGVPRTIDNTINIPGTSLDRKTLIHEVAHCWQYQEGIPVILPSLIAQFHAWRTTGSRDAAYDWHVVESQGIPFGDWNPEQQATWIEDHETLPADPFASAADSDPNATAPPPPENLPPGGTPDQ